MSEVHRVRGFSVQLLRALRFASSAERSAWLPGLLETVQSTLGVKVAYLGEAGADGCIRTAWVGGKLVERRGDRLQGVARRVVTQGATFLENEIQRRSPFRTTTDGWPDYSIAGYAAVPVPRPAPVKAWLSACRVKGDAILDPEAMELLHLAAEALGTALGNEERWRELQELAMTDGLTHIPNYRYLREALEREIGRATRVGEVFSVVMVDVDHLKKYNETHGHLAGSELLQRLAYLLREEIRESDMVAKYGGDEFLLILPRTDAQGGWLLGDRVRSSITARLRGRNDETVSCSFGVASFPADGAEFETLMSSADRALFQAKTQGRNQVVGRYLEAQGDPAEAPPAESSVAAVSDPARSAEAPRRRRMDLERRGESRRRDAA